MKTIKFRGRTHSGTIWAYGLIDMLRFDDNTWHYYIREYKQNGGYTDYEVDHNTIGQFTGLYDKNGEEIYEGDIFNIDELNGVISWHPNGYWCFHVAQDDVSKHSYITLKKSIEYAIRKKYDYEVIGNIHDTKTEEEE